MNRLKKVMEKKILAQDIELEEKLIVNKGKKVARHKLIHSFVLSLNVKPEHPSPEPAIFGIMDTDDDESVSFWVDKGNVDKFFLTIPKSWDFMVGVDGINSREYSLIGSMDQQNIIKENYNIPYFHKMKVDGNNAIY